MDKLPSNIANNTIAPTGMTSDNLLSAKSLADTIVEVVFVLNGRPVTISVLPDKDYYELSLPKLNNAVASIITNTLQLQLSCNFKNMYICFACKKNCFTKISFVKHMKIHINKPFICKLCFNPYASKASIYTHLQNEHDETDYDHKPIPTLNQRY